MSISVGLLLNTLAITLSVAAAQAAPQAESQSPNVTVRLAPTHIMLGERVILTLTAPESMSGQQLAEHFTQLNWQTLQDDWVIDHVDSNSERIRVTLYPLRAGVLDFPAIKAGWINAPQTRIEVSANPEVSIEWQAPPNSVYHQQNVSWNAKVTLSNSANAAAYQVRQPVHLLASSPSSSSSATHSGDQFVKVHVAPQPIELVSDAPKTLLLLANYQLLLPQTNLYSDALDDQAWSLSKPFTGQFLTSPVVTVKNPSQQVWRFYDVPRKVSVKALPQFLPVGMAVGQVQTDVAPVAFWAVTQTLQNWPIIVNAQGLNSAGLKQLAEQLTQEIGAHRLNQTAMEWFTESLTISEAFQPNGLHGQLVYNVPYRIIQPGLVTLPNLTLRLFNPHTGKLELVSIAPQTIVAWPVWALWCVAILGVVWLIWMLKIAVLKIKQAWSTHGLKQQIAQANTPGQIWAAMQTWQVQQTGGLSSQTLGQWQDWYRTRGLSSKRGANLKLSALTALMAQLNAQIFASQVSEVPWQTLKQSAQNWAKKP
jgi:hypothetical protein